VLNRRGFFLEIIGVDTGIVERVARTIRRNMESLERINVFDEKFYPPSSDDPEFVARYFIVMVAMDHRLSRPSRPYEACLGDGCYRGSDLLYRLGMVKYFEDPGFFSPERLAEISVDDVKKWLSVREATPPDPEIRALLLRDLGHKLIKLYNSSVLRLIQAANSRVHGSLEAPGLAENLKVFRAYEDPVEKKVMLLAKFLVARGLFKPVDELDVAVDNHLSRVAYRLGLVMISGPLWLKIKNSVEVSAEEDLILRFTVKRAYRYVASKSGLSTTVIDDSFWTMGRRTCTRDYTPQCERCLFKGYCRARRNTAFMVNEHVYYNTWYY
jgi:hypothetical protein